MLILDTDLLTIVQRKARPEFDQFLRHLGTTDEATIFATIISFEEQTRGWLAFIARGQEMSHQVVAYARLGAMLEY